MKPIEYCQKICDKYYGIYDNHFVKCTFKKLIAEDIIYKCEIYQKGISDARTKR